MTGSALELSIALSDNERTRPLLEGRVAPQGLKLVPTMIHPSEMFWRQLRFAEFDVSEMSMSSLLISTARGRRRWVGDPGLHHAQVLPHRHPRAHGCRHHRARRPARQARRRAGISADLRRSGRAASCSTNSACTRTTSNGSWSATPTRATAAPPASPPPAGVRVNQIPPSTNIGEMLVRGELDATLLYLPEQEPGRPQHGRSLGRPARPAAVPRPAAEGRRYFAKTGLYPINHTVVVRRSLLESHPWIALNLYSAFVAAKAEIARSGHRSCTGISRRACSTTV